jgi:hypothetical protein
VVGDEPLRAPRCHGRAWCGMSLSSVVLLRKLQHARIRSVRIGPDQIVDSAPPRRKSHLERDRRPTR